MAKTTRTFSKPALTAKQHISLMEERGLIIHDKNYANHMLSFVGYYHLSAYALSFQNADNTPNHHKFVEGSTFEDIVALYDFDRNLRLLVIDAVERIEIALRAVIIDSMSVSYDPHWYMNPEYFHGKFQHSAFLEKVQKDIGHGGDIEKIRDICIRHYYRHYDAPSMPPVWMICEALSLSTISLVFKHLNHSDKRRIAEKFGLPVAVLGSWLHSISYTRNLCAHHQRLWNRVFTIKPLIPRDRELSEIADELGSNAKFYAQVVILAALLYKIAPHSCWTERLQSVLKENTSLLRLQKMGFPKDWEHRKFWSHDT